MRIESYGVLVAAIAERPPRLGGARLVAVDGRSGSGKSTVAGRLARVAASAGWGVAVVHTDDVLRGWEHPLSTAGRIREWVLDPIARGESARYRPFDWSRMRPADEPVVVSPPGLLVMEGVGSARSDFHPLLSFNLFIYADVKVALSRVTDRDGFDVHDHLVRWQSQEDEYFARDDPRSRADVVVDGMTTTSPDRFAVLD